MHPFCATATGNYVVVATALSSTINLILNDKLNLPYAFLLSCLTLIGTVPGVLGQFWLVKIAGGRNQVTVLVILTFLLIVGLSVLPLSIVEA